LPTTWAKASNIAGDMLLYSSFQFSLRKLFT
jgi:hypothetical protein